MTSLEVIAIEAATLTVFLSPCAQEGRQNRRRPCLFAPLSGICHWAANPVFIMVCYWNSTLCMDAESVKCMISRGEEVPEPCCFTLSRESLGRNSSLQSHDLCCIPSCLLLFTTPFTSRTSLCSLGVGGTLAWANNPAVHHWASFSTISGSLKLLIPELDLQHSTSFDTNQPTNDHQPQPKQQLLYKIAVNN